VSLRLELLEIPGVAGFLGCQRAVIGLTRGAEGAAYQAAGLNDMYE
jgi:hypothetical protein